ncbi:mechanosensitive ion channel [Nocardioides panacihumi]|uniref:Mechanosensitive ion channel n=1 Tax=Nocardioides panacihumi TaxID=400774 RepID=A0ABN2RNH8_9ACTN
MTVSWTDFIAALVTACVIALVIVVLGTVAFRVAARYWSRGGMLAKSVRAPFRTFAGVVAVAVAVSRTPYGAWEWWPVVQHTLRIAVIASGAWLLGAMLIYIEDVSLRRHRTDVPDNLSARRVRTQVLLLRRLTVVAVVLLAIAIALFTFPGVRTFGASLLASAGVISVIVGIAAQSSLANVFAGMTIAFSDALRIDDAIIVENEWGWVEEITLTYVVVRLWDDRRLILPSTYFTQNPFQNWTRHASELLGAVELDVDWRVDTQAMRAALDRILEDTDLWDGRVKVLQVTDALAGYVRVRVLVTAKDAPTLFDLRCHVREQLVGWLQRHDEDGLPRQRTELVESSSHPYLRQRSTGTGLFTGDPEAEGRAARAGGGQQPET